MRLGLIIYGSLETTSGGFLYDRMLVQYLRQQGDEVEVISLPWRAYGRGLLDNLSPGLKGRLSRASYDLCLQDELTHPSLFWLNRRERHRRRRPVVSIVHHLRASEVRPAWQNRVYRWVERRYLAGVDGLVCNSRTTLETVQKLVANTTPVVVAYPGGDRFHRAISPEEIVARARARGPLRIIFPGNLIPRKGLHVLLSGLAMLPRAGWRLTVAGSLTMDPAYGRGICRQIEEAGLTPQVELLGPLGDEELAARLASSHLLAVPSTYEGFGIVYLEGMSLGVPAIGSRAGGAVEIITHGQDGFLVAPGDAGALAHYVGRLMADRELLAAMSLAARQRYLAHPTWADGGALIHRFLHSFLS